MFFFFSSHVVTSALAGLLREKDFIRGLEELGLDVDESDARKLCSKYDLDGRVDWREAAKAISPDDGGDAADGVGDVMDKLRGLVRDAVNDGLDPREIFEHFDKDNSGDIDDSE